MCRALPIGSIRTFWKRRSIIRMRERCGRCRSDTGRLQDGFMRLKRYRDREARLIEEGQREMPGRQSHPEEPAHSEGVSRIGPDPSLMVETRHIVSNTLNLGSWRLA